MASHLGEIAQDPGFHSESFACGSLQSSVEIVVIYYRTYEERGT